MSAPGSRASTATATATGVTITGVVRRFGEAQVLSGLSLSVAPGELMALLGPSGSGKTTLLRLIAGLDRPDGGTIDLGDRRVAGGSTFVPAERRGVGLVFQDWALFPHLSVAANVGFGLPRPERRASPRIDTALARVGMVGFGDRRPDTLSGGQQQRVALARAMAPSPRVLLLDEPFSNLDAGLRTDVRSEVRRTLRSIGVTAIFVTHDRDEAFTLGDRVAIVNEGRIAQVGTPEEVYATPSDRWVAGFLGDANFVPGTIEAGRPSVAVSPLGPLPIRGIVGPGPVSVLLRPEALTIRPTIDGRAGGSGGTDDGALDGTDPGTGWRVTEAEFLGHSTLTRVTPIGGAVAASDGEALTLSIRTGGAPPARPGEVVDVTYSGGPAVAWAPAEEPPGPVG